MKEHFTKPFFFLQIICSAVFLFDDYFYSAIISLFTISMVEFFSVQSRLKQEGDLDMFKPKVMRVNIVRQGKSLTVSSDELIQGDIAILSKEGPVDGTGNAEVEDLVVPADLIILEGKAIVDESLLTGESIPISKDNVTTLDTSTLIDRDLQKIKQCVLFAGTKVIETSNSARSSSVHIRCLVLRTGR
mmetsp:Transcript_98350/g.212064  ORF Transcript_98350/g.212064 Transcript_98350/m.212064 type:complete len:188 (+) Transcript_98350:812-1375(+)